MIKYSTRDEDSAVERIEFVKNGKTITLVNRFDTYAVYVEEEDDDGRCGTGWIYDGDHNWEVEDDHVAILGPVKIDLVDANGYGDSAVIEENVEPYDHDNEKDPTEWPFPTEK